MPADDLSAPLGQTKKAKRFRSPVAPATAIAGVLGSVLVVFFGWALVANDPFGGEPTASVAIAPSPMGDMSTKAEQPARQVQAAPADDATPSQRTVTIIDGSTGKRQEVPLAGGSDTKPASPTGGDPKLLESTRHGMIPKVGADGTRPADAYARPKIVEATRASAPKIAIVVTGLGIGAKLTADAIDKLPPPVTLAFAPYGPDASRYAVQARGAGHEILLQVAMEPFEYPDNDPGPQTLLTSLALDQNIDRLHWMMSRFQGYVGVANYMGARFTATEQAFAPVLKEVAKRGLLYFDDGSSQRSLAAQISGANRLGFTKSDVAIDAVPTPADIGKALTRLESTARANGVAVGSISALPVSIERVAAWAKSVESRGFVLVPISAAAARGKSS